jgi:hypothetical protein
VAQRSDGRRPPRRKPVHTAPLPRVLARSPASQRLVLHALLCAAPGVGRMGGLRACPAGVTALAGGGPAVLAGVCAVGKDRGAHRRRSRRRRCGGCLAAVALAGRGRPCASAELAGGGGRSRGSGGAGSDPSADPLAERTGGSGLVADRSTWRSVCRRPTPLGVVWPGRARGVRAGAGVIGGAVVADAGTAAAQHPRRDDAGRGKPVRPAGASPDRTGLSPCPGVPGMGRLRGHRDAGTGTGQLAGPPPGKGVALLRLRGHPGYRVLAGTRGPAVSRALPHPAGDGLAPGSDAGDVSGPAGLVTACGDGLGWSETDESAGVAGAAGLVDGVARADAGRCGVDAQVSRGTGGARGKCGPGRVSLDGAGRTDPPSWLCCSWSKP